MITSFLATWGQNTSDILYHLMYLIWWMYLHGLTKIKQGMHIWCQRPSGDTKHNPCHRTISTIWHGQTSKRDLINQYTFFFWPAVRIWPYLNLRTTSLTLHRVESIPQQSTHTLYEHQLVKHTRCVCVCISKSTNLMSLGSIKDGKRRSF